MPEYRDPITRRIGWTPVRVGALIFGVLLVLATLVATPMLVENLAARDVMIIQSIGGDLNCYTDPGPKWQGLGSVTTYPRQGTYSFDQHSKDEDSGKLLQFNDGGKGKLYGSVNWQMPLDCKQIVAIHKQFGSAKGIEARGVAKMVNSAVYLSGLAMSSTESAAERRGELVELINDQAQNGVHQTVTHTVERPDPITGEKRMVAVVEILRDDKGRPKRQQGSILEQYGVQLQPMAIEKLVYDDVVEKQIAERQKATQQVQLAQANARKAEQDAITVAKQGEAKAAEARWAQETIKAKEVTAAQQRLEVQTLAAKEAEQYKREQILRGEGDAQRRELLLAADGALDQKLEAYKQVNAIWATSFANYGGAMVPAVQWGGGAAGGPATAVGGAQALLDMLATKTARELSIDMSSIGTAGKKPAAAARK